jgi:DNA-binding LytR/AlgR family response regulator
MRCLLVDDEPLASERLRALLAEAMPGIEVVGEARSGKEAVELVARLQPEVVFLDVQMPGLDGLDVAERIGGGTSVVFVTAHEQHAVHAFEHDAVDYLTKPVRLDRLRRTMARLQARLAAQGDAEAPAGHEAGGGPLHRVTLRAGHRLLVMETEKVIRFEAEEKSVTAHLAADPRSNVPASATTDLTLDTLGERLPQGSFLRVHRAHLVNTRAILELIPWFAGTYRLRLSGGAEVPVARRRVRAVRAALGA